MPYLYVPGLGDSTLVSKWWNPPSELYATSNGTCLPRASSWPGWKKRPWIQHLSGTISNPSRVSSGVGRLIASLGAYPVNHGVKQADDVESTITATCGHTSSPSFAIWESIASSWRTSQGSLLPGLDTFLGTWPTSGSMRNGECFPAPEWAPLTDAGESLSWPTPAARDYRSVANRWTWKNSRPLNEVAAQYTLRVLMGIGDPSIVNCGLRLNPLFAEWLMGLPLNWTHPFLPTACAPWVTQFRLKLQERLGLNYIGDFVVANSQIFGELE
jgi:hypothetical protein